MSYVSATPVRYSGSQLYEVKTIKDGVPVQCSVWAPSEFDAIVLATSNPKMFWQQIPAMRRARGS